MKQKLPKTEHVVIAGLALLVSVLSYSYFNVSPSVPQVQEANASKIKLNPEEISASQVSWAARFAEVSPQQAYDEFKLAQSELNVGSQHVLAHGIGTLIFENAGLEGVNVCDDSFSFGCYHGFFSSALSQRGPEIIEQLDIACNEKYGPLGSGCQHGIGHGLMDYYGPNRLDVALDACLATTIPSELAGCPSGVFMEYNVPILISEDDVNAAPREFDENDPYNPCGKVQKQFRAACYYALPQWWMNSVPADFATMGVYCDGIKDQAMEDFCILGIGNITPTNSNYDVDAAIALCKQMPNMHSTVLCQAGSSWSFDATLEYRHLASKLCEQLETPYSEECIHKAHFMNPENDEE